MWLSSMKKYNIGGATNHYGYQSKLHFFSKVVSAIKEHEIPSTFKLYQVSSTAKKQLLNSFRKISVQIYIKLKIQHESVQHG